MGDPAFVRGCSLYQFDIHDRAKASAFFGPEAILISNSPFPSPLNTKGGLVAGGEE